METKAELVQVQPDKLFYISNSKKVAPGKGVHESISDPSRYTTLYRTLDFRQVLSNFYEAEFKYASVIDGVEKTYRTVEHVFQSEKFRVNGFIETADEFTLESGCKLGKGSGLDARRARKAVLLDGDQLEKWADIQPKVLKAAFLAKFGQNDYPRQILLATNDAELWHGSRGVPPARQFELEQARLELRGK
eukprot:Colp12_sorted_trinity150504_noHs@9967